LRDEPFIATFGRVHSVLVLRPDNCIFDRIIESERGIVDVINHFLRECGVKRLSSIAVYAEDVFNGKMKVVDVYDRCLRIEASKRTPTAEPKG
jgi:hypothetical protein